MAQFQLMPLPKDVPLIPSASISVLAGSSLTFSANNWNTYQYVKLAATADNNHLNGQATIRLSAASLSPLDITAIKGGANLTPVIIELLLAN